jgi:POT family proton-dependent oligopeptide transporter
MQSVNAVLVLVFVPLFALVAYPLLERAGVRMTSLRKMGCGFFLAGASFIAAAWVQARLDAHEALSVGWQFLQYGLMTAGEVLISTTGLAFAFTQAPARLKSIIMSFWTLTVALGNFFAAFCTRINSHSVHASKIQELLFYAAVVTLAGIVFVAVARKFPERQAEAAK